MSERKQLFEVMRETPPERRWRQQAWPVLGVVTLIRRVHGEQERFLLIQRRKPPYAGQWALVGGKVEFGETLAQAAVREVQEETGLASEFVAVRGVVNERMAPHSADGDGQAGHFLLFVCAVDAPHGVASEQAEGKVDWFTLDELEQMDEEGAIVASDYAMIHHFAPLETTVPYYEAEMIVFEETETDMPAPSRLSRFQRMA